MIVTVALVPPKRGVFQESVKHVLVVATTVEVVLLAVTYQQGEKPTGGGSGSNRNRRLQVRATQYSVFPYDLVACVRESSGGGVVVFGSSRKRRLQVCAMIRFPCALVACARKTDGGSGGGSGCSGCSRDRRLQVRATVGFPCNLMACVCETTRGGRGAAVVPVRAETDGECVVWRRVASVEKR